MVDFIMLDLTKIAGCDSEAIQWGMLEGWIVYDTLCTYQVLPILTWSMFLFDLE